jgi:hypothetical protein
MRRIADEHIGLLTVISLTQKQLEEIGSDKLPSFPWDLGVRFVSTMFMLTQVAPESLTLHLGLGCYRYELTERGGGELVSLDY